MEQTSPARLPLPRLGAWYAAPCTLEQAAALRQRSETRLQQRVRRGQGAFTARLLRLVANFWLGVDPEPEYRSLAAQFGRRSLRARALLELVCGQLLMARRLTGATEHLERGFSLARHLLTPADYFAVLKRHTLLARLPLEETPAPPLDLDALFTTARVIERMEGQLRRRPRHDPNDTYG